MAIEDALEKHSRPKLETFGDALFIVTYSPIREHGILQFIETHIFAGKGYIITARNGHSASYAHVRQRCEARPLLLEHGEDFVLYALLDFVIENYQPVAKRSTPRLMSWSVMPVQCVERARHSEVARIAP